MLPPRYQEVPAATIPHGKIPGASADSEVIVIAGECVGIKGPVETRTPITYVDVRLAPGDELTQATPASHTAMAYIYHGSGMFGPERKVAGEGQLVLFDSGDDATMRAGEKGLRFLFLAGEPLKIPVVSHGPFVMTTMEEIEQAFEDYHSGKLGAIPGAEERYAETAKATGRIR